MRRFGWPVKSIRPVLLAMMVLFPSVSYSEENLQDKTKQAESRVEAWDVEQTKLDKRSKWELPLAIALFAAGGALASRNKVWAYSASFGVAAGLTFHFFAGSGVQ